MKKVKLVMEATLEVPDDWTIVCPTEDLQEHLFTKAKFLCPMLDWHELEEVEGESSSSVKVSEEMFMKLDAMTTFWDYSLRIEE